MLRVAGSLVTNQVRAYDLLRMFGREGHPTPLGQGFAEYGRIAKTQHLLALVDPIDDTYQRAMNRQLSIQESRHRLARKILLRVLRVFGRRPQHEVRVADESAVLYTARCPPCRPRPVRATVRR